VLWKSVPVRRAGEWVDIEMPKEARGGPPAGSAATNAAIIEAIGSMVGAAAARCWLAERGKRKGCT
jgi:hypothetical protein